MKSNELLEMWTNQHIAARTLIWLAAIAIPVQGLPAASCACSVSHPCCQQEKLKDGGCATEKPGDDCCSARRQAALAHDCCCCQRGKDPGCKCGPGCQCGKAKPTEPAAPPIENDRPTEKVVSGAAFAGLIAAVAPYSRNATPQLDASRELNAASALDRCVILGRLIV